MLRMLITCFIDTITFSVRLAELKMTCLATVVNNSSTMYN